MIESLLLSLLLILPLSYVVIFFGSLQRTAIGARAAAREGGRAYVTSRLAADADAHARRAINETLASHGLDASRSKVTIDGQLRRGTTVTVLVDYLAPAASVPFLADVPVIHVVSRHAEVVDRFRSLDAS